MNLGILAHTFGKLPVKQLAEIVAAHDLHNIQLALTKAIGDFDVRPGQLSPGLANHIGGEFHRNGVRIAVLGCYINPIHPDPEQRRIEINRFKEHLRYARDFGTGLVATETGSRTTYRDTNPDSYLEKCWDLVKSAFEEIAEEAEKWGVTAAIEPVFGHTIHTSEHMQRLLEEIPSSHLGVLIDPCNMMDQPNAGNQEEFLGKAFELWGDRIVLAHAKDFRYDEAGRKLTLPSGQGDLDYPLFLRMLKERKPWIDISMEGVTAGQAPEAAAFMRQVIRDSGK